MSAARIAKSALKIPMRIERGPTDILKALSSTVKLVANAANELIQDDPYLMPRRAVDRKNYNMAKLSGAKTARYFLEKNPELFLRDDSEPKIEDFKPSEEFSPDMDLNEEDLKWCIENGDAGNGLIAYNSMLEKKVSLSNETLLQFFELLCFTNEEKPSHYIDVERARFLQVREEQLENHTWKTSGSASKIFNQIKEDLDPPRVYSAMIAGLVKYNEHETARQVFEDFKTNHPDKALYSIAYSSLLESVRKLHSSLETARGAIDEIVRHMQENLVKPDILVFNSILQIYRYIYSPDGTELAFEFINDMKSLDVEPSFFTLGTLIQLITRHKMGTVHGMILPDIMAYIEAIANPTLTLVDVRDKVSFGTTMNSLAHILKDTHLSKRLFRIYEKNPNLFDSSRSESFFLNAYFKLLVTTSSLEKSLEFYDNWVPSRFKPFPDSYEALVAALDLYQANEDVVKKIGQDIIKYGLAKKIENDAIFRKDQSYLDALEKLEQ